MERGITRAKKKKIKHISLTNSQVMTKFVAKLEHHDKSMSLMTIYYGLALYAFNVSHKEYD